VILRLAFMIASNAFKYLDQFTNSHI
jgi:hypothetical protein